MIFYMSTCLRTVSMSSKKRVYGYVQLYGYLKTKLGDHHNSTKNVIISNNILHTKPAIFTPSLCLSSSEEEVMRYFRFHLSRFG